MCVLYSHEMEYDSIFVGGYLNREDKTYVYIEINTQNINRKYFINKMT